MANWGKISARGNVEDRRAMLPAAVGGIGVAGVVLLLLFNVMTGGDPADILTQLEDIPVEQQNVDTREFEGSDNYEVFTSTVLGSNNRMWTELFAKADRIYDGPRLVLFRGATESECGTAVSEAGPHYCPLDRTIYLDETFFDELVSRLGATGGDVAEAYVIAHEVGHHVQNELGLMERSQLGMVDSDMSVQLELQADCFAGLWANSLRDMGIFEPGEIHEAMDAASAVGDDRIQERTTGYVNPETWTHGSSRERVEWFDKGYETGRFSSCDTSG